jgi:fructokinase
VNSPTVLCLGEVLYDCLADQLGLSLDRVRSWTQYEGGAPANVAAALVKLGTPAAFVGAVGRDAQGGNLVRLLEEIGVDVRGVQFVPNAPTRTVLVLRSHGGDRQFAAFGAQTATTDFADTRLQSSQLSADLFTNVQYLVVGTLALATPDSGSAMRQAMAWTQQQGGKIVMDVNWRPMFWPQPDRAPAVILDVIRQVDFLKLSDEESEWLFQTDCADEVASQFPQLQGVLITAGAAGCRYWLMGNRGMLPAFDVLVEDTTGAGDGFLAGFIHCLAAGELGRLRTADDAAMIVRYASAVGALTTMASGAIEAQPTAVQVNTFLNQFTST